MCNLCKNASSEKPYLTKNLKKSKQADSAKSWNQKKIRKFLKNWNWKGNSNQNTNPLKSFVNKT